MRLYINEQMVLPVLGSIRLRKSRSEAAATLTATLYTAPADTYFLNLSLSLGDRIQLLNENDEEVFGGYIHELDRTPDSVYITAYDLGFYLTRNKLRGVFCGTPAEIITRVAAALDLPTGLLEVSGGWKNIVAHNGQNAFSILRKIAGEDREISIKNGTLNISKSAYIVYSLSPSQIISAEGRISLESMVNRCEVTDRKGALLAIAENPEDISRYGRMQTVLMKDGTDPAVQAQTALRRKTVSGSVVITGNSAYCCGCAVELHCSEWGLDGVYAVTAVEHRWEKGVYTTAMDLEFIR